MVLRLSSPPVTPDPLSFLHWAVMLLLQDATLEKVTRVPMAHDSNKMFPVQL